jgi:6-methylsalicylate decarboxylase
MQNLNRTSLDRPAIKEKKGRHPFKIDIHGHFLPPSYKGQLAKHGITRPDNYPMPTWSLEQQIEGMDALNISYSALSISSPHLNFGDDEEAKIVARKSNEEGAAFVRDYPDRLGLMASLPLPNVDYSLAEIEYAFDVLHADGVTMPTNALGVYLGNPVLDPIFKELNRRKTVISIHPVKPAAVPENVNVVLPYTLMEFFFDTTRTIFNLIMNRTLKKFPDINFIVPHAGACIPILSDRIGGFVLTPMYAGPKEDTAMDVWGELKLLYYDLAGFPVSKQLGVLLKIADTDHLLYGCDTPFTPVPYITYGNNQLDETPLLNDRDRAAIYRGNALKLFSRAK